MLVTSKTTVYWLSAEAEIASNSATCAAALPLAEPASESASSCRSDCCDADALVVPPAGAAIESPIELLKGPGVVSWSCKSNESWLVTPSAKIADSRETSTTPPKESVAKSMTAARSAQVRCRITD